jgi:hypothetical protein
MGTKRGLRLSPTYAGKIVIPLSTDAYETAGRSAGSRVTVELLPTGSEAWADAMRGPAGAAVGARSQAELPPNWNCRRKGPASDAEWRRRRRGHGRAC